MSEFVESLMRRIQELTSQLAAVTDERNQAGNLLNMLHERLLALSKWNSEALAVLGGKETTMTTMTTMTIGQLRDLAKAALFPDPNVAAAVAMAESSGDPNAVGDSGQSFGLWQVNRPSHPEFVPSLLLTPWYAAQAAYSISKRGTDWQPWTTYRNGAYKKYMT